MASRGKDQAAPHHHQPLLSSLVVRPSNTEGGGDYDSGEVHRDPPAPYSRSDRYSDEPALMLPARTWALRKAFCYECCLGS
ncbi:hypothetical protein L6164_007951 [Bauhinia variegata]|uniref:Uncharacterized protein n=1 Tax=Bauhinia variegata TaxID=167791 RepID=A0ACB9PF71_BAUVA|nr:hypothetical protein L6164_007951 [Bauhinia variegata]